MRHLVLVISMTHRGKCKLNIGAHKYQDVSIIISDIKVETEPEMPA